MNDFDSMCPNYERAVEALCRRWTWRILRSLMNGPRRFSDIGNYVEGLSDRLLSQRLQELEADGIVVRTVRSQRPVSVEYALTPKGQALRRPVEALQLWADRWCAPETKAKAQVSAKGRRRVAVS